MLRAFNAKARSMAKSDPYVHGYAAPEARRLSDQADALAARIHAGVVFADDARVLEPGCGVGAQTLRLAAASPGARFVAFDRDETSLAHARARLAAAGLSNVELLRADLSAPPFAEASFDAIFVCFLLEHLPDPQATLTRLRGLLKPGGEIIVVEGDHGSTLFHPDDADARAAIAAQIALQARAGGDALIGRRLHPLLTAAGFVDVAVEPLTIYADAARPALQRGFTRDTFAAMIRGLRAPALAQGLIDAPAFDRGVAALERCAAPDGVFVYLFFKARARPAG